MNKLSLVKLQSRQPPSCIFNRAFVFKFTARIKTGHCYSDPVIPLDKIYHWVSAVTESYRSWVCLDWSEITSVDQSKHRYGKLASLRVNSSSVSNEITGSVYLYPCGLNTSNGAAINYWTNKWRAEEGDMKKTLSRWFTICVPNYHFFGRPSNSFSLYTGTWADLFLMRMLFNHVCTVCLLTI